MHIRDILHYAVLQIPIDCLSARVKTCYTTCKFRVTSIAQRYVGLVLSRKRLIAANVVIFFTSAICLADEPGRLCKAEYFV